jgi:hypothetical protein
MKWLARIWKKLLTAALAGGISLVIAACYGTPYNYAFVGTWTIHVKSKTNVPIPGLKVSILEYVVGYAAPDSENVVYTDSNGIAFTQLETYHSGEDYHHAALIQDIDSLQNGGAFRDTLIAKNAPDSSTVILNPQ